MEAIIYAIGASGSLGRCHYVNGKFIASNLCLVLTPQNTQKYPVNLLFYSLYLNAIRQYIRNEIADGTSKLTISVDDLNNYLIEYIPLDTQNKIAQEYETKVLAIKDRLIVAEKEMDDLLRKL
jgi:type I restriction enzyme S subunit